MDKQGLEKHIQLHSKFLKFVRSIFLSLNLKKQTDLASYILIVIRFI